MWEVSDRFLSALSKPHALITEASVTVPGGDPVELGLTAGSISADSASNYRRTGTLTVIGGRDVYEALSTPGAAISVDHGLDFGSTQELVPVFFGEVASAVQPLGDGSAKCRLVDLGKWIERTRFLVPYSPVVGATRPSVVAALVEDARPGTDVMITSTDTGTVGALAWDDSRQDPINDLCKDGSSEAFWLPDGTYLIRDQLTLTSPPVWTVRAGASGVLSSAERTRPLDKLYNTVVVRPSATDGSQTWDPQVAQVTDPAHPRHPDKIGVVPYVWPSPTAATAAAALTAAYSILARVLGTTETLSLGMVSNPALEAGDVIRVVTPQMGREEPDIVTHFIDSFDLDLMTGAMTMQTRSQADA